MRSPFSIASSPIIILNSLLHLVSGIGITQPLLHYCPNPHSVLLNPICPASTQKGQYIPPNDIPGRKSKHHPWSEEPTCLRIINLSGEHNYCIHTSTEFANGRGISVVTSPSVADAMAISPAFDPSASTSNQKTPFDDPSSSNSPPPFEVKEIPGRGKGIIANRTIKFGETISYHTPILVIEREIFDIISNEQRFPLLRDAISKLPASTQNLFYEQCTKESGVTGGHESPDDSVIEDILKTNSYSGYFPSFEEMEVGAEGENVEHGLNIPESSRLNHDCRPNTHFWFDPSTLTHKIHATTTIQPGEEITTSYIDVLDSYGTRQGKLLKHWGFHCNCPLCSAGENARTQSDSRLSLIQKYREYLVDWGYESVGTPELCLKYIKLLREEKLYTKLGEAYVIAALRFNAWEKEDKAKEFAQLAVENGLWWDTNEAEELEEMKKLGLEGRRHWSWGLARKLRIGQDGTAPVDEHVAVAGMRLVKQQVIR